MSTQYIHPAATGTNSVYDLMHKAQNGKCYLCGRAYPEPFDSLQEFLEYRKEIIAIRVGNHPMAANKLTKYLVQDHDHITGIVRALLCPSCNQMISGLDNIVALGWLDRALEYLKLGRLQV